MADLATGYQMPRLRSAALLSEGTAGSDTKTNRARCVPCAGRLAQGSLRKGRRAPALAGCDGLAGHRPRPSLGHTAEPAQGTTLSGHGYPAAGRPAGEITDQHSAEATSSAYPRRSLGCSPNAVAPVLAPTVSSPCTTGLARTCRAPLASCRLPAGRGPTLVSRSYGQPPPPAGPGPGGPGCRPLATQLLGKAEVHPPFRWPGQTARWLGRNPALAGEAWRRGRHGVRLIDQRGGPSNRVIQQSLAAVVQVHLVAVQRL